MENNKGIIPYGSVNWPKKKSDSMYELCTSEINIKNENVSSLSKSTKNTFVLWSLKKNIKTRINKREECSYCEKRINETGNKNEAAAIITFVLSIIFIVATYQYWPYSLIWAMPILGWMVLEILKECEKEEENEK